MKAIFKKSLSVILFFLFLSISTVCAQNTGFQDNRNQGLIRIASTSQLADTLNVWGDVKESGKFLVPRGTNLTDLISYARGPVGITQGTAFDIINLEVYVARYNPQLNQFINNSFELKLNEPLPDGMVNYQLENGDIVTVKANRKATFRDYFTIIGPILSLGLSAILVFDRLDR